MAETKYIPVAMRRFVQERAARCCEYCRSHDSFSTETFEVEHIQPRATGGLTVMHNLAYACSGCNGRKAARTKAADPKTREVVPLFHPRLDEWREHFAWSNHYTEMVGLTASGRATIAVMQLNRPALVNLRRVLVLAGEHPPP